MIKRLNIRVAGKVQGVFFRHYTSIKAKELGLAGVVKNESDGTVLIEVEGDEKKMEAFVAWCHSGSPLSKVTSVAVSEIKPEGGTSFSILR